MQQRPPRLLPYQCVTLLHGTLIITTAQPGPRPSDRGILSVHWLIFYSRKSRKQEISCQLLAAIT